MRKVIVFLFLASCSHQDVIKLTDKKLEGKKEVAITTDDSGVWLYKLIAEIEKQGVSVKRTSSTGETTITENGKSFKYEQAASRYILKVNGSVDHARRCFGGGHTFNNLSLEVFDSQENKGVAMFTDSGYSEGCPPAISSMFEDLAKNVRSLWD